MTIDQNLSDVQHIADCVRQLRDRYIAQGEARSYYAINDGICDEFAEDLAALLTPRLGARVRVVEGANFTVDGEGDVFDRALLKRYWQIAPPPGFTWEELDAVGFGHHVWVAVDQRHYDAECPEGVDSFFDLPLYRRYRVADLRERGIACDDVVTEDVVPPPACEVPNPEPA